MSPPRRHELSDEQWEKLEPLLPKRVEGRAGRRAKDHRMMLNGMLWIAKTGAPWRDLPERYGPWQSVATRFYRWTRQGVWQTMLAALQQDADARGDVEWDLHHMDGSVVRAHQSAGGAKRGTQKSPQTPQMKR